MKTLLVGDVHLADRPPSMRTDSYLDDILSKLLFTVDVAKKLEPHLDAVIWSGDVFHTKTPHRTSHRLVQRVLEVGQQYPCPWLIVPGNHDLQHDRLDSLESQPLGTLFQSGSAVPLIGSHPTLPLFGIPFLQDWKDLHIHLQEFRKDTNRLLVTHAPIMPPGVSVPYEYIDATDWAEQQGGGACYYGHIHDTHGSYGAGSVRFCNQGALSRGSLHETDLRRKPAIALYDSEQLNENIFRRIEVPHRPIAEVMKLAEHEQEEAKIERLDEFLSRISDTTLESLSIEAVLQHLATLDLSQQTTQIVKESLEVAMS